MVWVKGVWPMWEERLRSERENKEERERKEDGKRGWNKYEKGKQ